MLDQNEQQESVAQATNEESENMSNSITTLDSSTTQSESSDTSTEDNNESTEETTTQSSF